MYIWRWYYVYWSGRDREDVFCISFLFPAPLPSSLPCLLFLRRRLHINCDGIVFRCRPVASFYLLRGATLIGEVAEGSKRAQISYLRARALVGCSWLWWGVSRPLIPPPLPLATSLLRCRTIFSLISYCTIRAGLAGLGNRLHRKNLGLFLSFTIFKVSIEGTQGTFSLGAQAAIAAQQPGPVRAWQKFVNFEPSNIHESLCSFINLGSVPPPDKRRLREPIDFKPLQSWLYKLWSALNLFQGFRWSDLYKNMPNERN